MPPAADITASQADRPLGLVTEACAEVEHVVAGLHRLDTMEASLARIEGLLAPVALHYAALNKAREDADAAKTVADARLQSTWAEWLAKLTPTRIGVILATMASLLLGGGVASGTAGRVQAVYDALTGPAPVAEAPIDDSPTPGGVP